MHLVFDLDGTLVDSVGDLAAAATELVTSLGGRPLAPVEVGLMVGDGAGLLVRRALAAAGLDPDTPGALPRFLDIYSRRMLETTVAYPGTAEMLQLASRDAILSVLTNKPEQHSRHILDALGLSAYFAHIVGGDGPLGRKPDPAALRAMASGDARVMLIGDSPVDWHTAEAAGCAFAWARYGFGARRFENPPATPYVIERPADFAAVHERFAAVTSGV